MTASWKRSGFLLSLAIILLVGCNPQSDGQRIQSAQADFAKVRDQFLSQQGYSFHGRTKLLTGTTANGNLVNFAGRVNGRDTLLDVELSMPEEKRAKTLSLLSRDQKLFAQMDGKGPWQPVGGDNHSLRQEFNNWDPRFSFQQMDEMAARIIPLNENTGNANISSLRVVLDSTKLKGWLAEQLRKQNGAVQVQSVAHAARIPYAVTLSDGQMTQPRRGVTVQKADSNVKDVISGMDLEAQYTVYYDRTSMLPTRLLMNIRSDYTINNQRINEHSEVQTYLLNYGQKFNLPAPSGK